MQKVQLLPKSLMIWPVIIPLASRWRRGDFWLHFWIHRFQTYMLTCGVSSEMVISSPVPRLLPLPHVVQTVFKLAECNRKMYNLVPLCSSSCCCSGIQKRWHWRATRSAAFGFRSTRVTTSSCVLWTIFLRLISLCERQQALPSSTLTVTCVTSSALQTTRLFGATLSSHVSSSRWVGHSFGPWLYFWNWCRCTFNKNVFLLALHKKDMKSGWTIMEFFFLPMGSPSGMTLSIYSSSGRKDSRMIKFIFLFSFWWHLQVRHLKVESNK